MDEFNEKLKMLYSGNHKIPLQVIIIACIIAVVSCLLLMETFKSYRSEVTLMLIARSDYSVADKQEIAGNLAELPKLLSFYELLLKDNPAIVDRNAGRGAEKRKAAWNEILEVKNISNGSSSLISLGVTMPNSNDADFIAEKTAHTLVAITGRYYDISKDIDLRIVDGPITKPVINNWPSIILLSASSGVAVLLIYSFSVTLALPKYLFSRKRYSFAALHGIRDIFTKQEDASIEESAKKKEIEAIYTDQENFDASTHGIYEKKDLIAPRVPDNLPIAPDDSLLSAQYPNFPEMPITQTKTAGAPVNLPFAEEDIFTFEDDGAKKNPNDEIIEMEEKIPSKEPSQEELKKRLNQLLQGEL